ncbi:MAG: cation-binding protein [Pseudonocardiales bacterium]|nr:cation-binding protein [Pseudonocardiales bacterium]
MSGHVNGFVRPEPGSLVAVEVDGTPVAVTTVDGELRAFTDTCPHAGCSLADGELDGPVVTCPCHLARFDVVTGAVLDGPAGSGVDTWSAELTDGTLELTGPHPAASEPARKTSSPTTAPAAASSDSDVDIDITVLIEREHEALRRQFAAIQEMSDVSEIEQAWTALVNLLEIHASGEEALLYPHLADVEKDSIHEAEHAVRDHNAIRDSVREVSKHEIGGDDWWSGVRAASAANNEHLGEEERDLLPVFRDHTESATRQKLGRQWLTFHDEHQDAQGLTGQDVNPEAVVHR